MDVQSLPRFGDGWTFLYAEHVRVERDALAVVLRDERGSVAVPTAALSVLMLGPGVTITHAAVTALTETGASIVWCGEAGVRCYASGLGETHRSANLLHQVEAYADESRRMEVVKRMYRLRFSEPLPDDLTLQQIRGKEGVRVREAYAEASRKSGIPWSGRQYDRGAWNKADPVNRALSTANACLYGLCHAAVVSTGFSPALGFVHTGKALSFVYDIADLYKVELTVPLAFEMARQGTADLERRTRRLCRSRFYLSGLIRRIVPDIQRVLGLKPEPADLLVHDADDEGVVGLWDPTLGAVSGGQNYADESETTS